MFTDSESRAEHGIQEANPYYGRVSDIAAVVFVCAFALAFVSAIGMGVVAIIRAARGVGVEKASSKESFCAVVHEAGGRELGEGIAISRDGVEYVFEYVSNSEGPAKILASRSISTTKNADSLRELPAMTLREENDRDRLGKSLGLNLELQTGDERFDAGVYIECDEPSATAMLSSPEVRAGVIGLLGTGYDHVAFRLGGHALVASRTEGVREFNPRVVEDTIRHLAQVADALPPFWSVPVERSMTRGGKAVIASSLVASVALVAAIFSESRWDPLDGGLNGSTLVLSLFVFVAEVALVWALVRRRSLALRYFSWAAAAGLLLAPSLSRAALVACNGAGDEAITTYSRPLEHKHVSQGDDSTTYYLHFGAVPGMKDSSAVISVSRERFVYAAPGDVYQLTVGAGRLGVPWLVELQLAP